MIPFLKELRLAENAHVDLRRNFIWVLGLMLAIPPADWLDELQEVNEELPSGLCDVPTEGTPNRTPYRAALGG